jgi:hypothetical protein
MHEFEVLRKAQDAILKEEEAKFAKADAKLKGNGPMMKAKTDRQAADIEIKKLKLENECLDINLEAEKACMQILEDKLEEENDKKKTAEKVNDDLKQ